VSEEFDEDVTDCIVSSHYEWFASMTVYEVVWFEMVDNFATGTMGRSGWMVDEWWKKEAGTKCKEILSWVQNQIRRLEVTEGWR
jgi:hypothetical protein